MLSSVYAFAMALGATFRKEWWIYTYLFQLLLRDECTPSPPREFPSLGNDVVKHADRFVGSKTTLQLFLPLFFCGNHECMVVE